MEPTPAAADDMKRELERIVHHLVSMVRTARRLAPDTAVAACGLALETHLRGLTPAALGLPDKFVSHAARIEARAADEAKADGLGYEDAAVRAG